MCVALMWRPAPAAPQDATNAAGAGFVLLCFTNFVLIIVLSKVGAASVERA